MNPIKRVIPVFLITLLVVVLVPVLARSDDDKAGKINELLQKYHDFRHFNGTALVADRGKIIYKKGFGLANLDWEIPNDEHTKFRIGSITKQFAAVLTLQQVEAGKIELDAPITDYLPDYRSDTGNRVTIHHLLTHTSGIPSYTGLPGFWSDSTRNPYSLEYMTENFLNGDLEFTPGSEYRYNNSGYYLLGIILEKVSGLSFEALLQQQILDPAGMADTGVDRHELILKNRARGYIKTGAGFTPDPYFHMKNAYAAGAMYSTIGDLYKWDRALTNGGLLTPASLKKMYTPFLSDYGYGWIVRRTRIFGQEDSLTVVTHGGGINGFNTLIYRIIEDEHLVVLLNNTGSTRLRQMAQAIQRILYNKKFIYPKMPVDLHLAEVGSDIEMTAAISEYWANKNKFEINEAAVNALGYQRLRGGRIAEAIQLFALNNEAFPVSANTFDSLAEGYLENGEKDRAIATYRKALEINPRFEHAKTMLRQIGEKVDVNLGEEITLPADLLQNYVGSYELQPGFIITINVDGDRLIAQATAQPSFQIYPLSKTRFFYKVVNAQIKFDLDERGIPKSMALLQNGQIAQGKKLE